MMELNKIYCIDALDGLKKLPDKTIDLIITSPPYNKRGFNGSARRTEHCIWNKTIDYSNYDDNMDEDDYEQWQITILNECFRVLKDDGSMFYNHKIRVKNNQISHPIEWISKSHFHCRQIITWDRYAGTNVDKCRYVPVSELIFWLCKTKRNPRFKRNKNAFFQTEVWRFPAEKNNNHPAPFPLALPNNIIPSVAQGEKIVVLDPFVGSGTVCISAMKNGCDFIGFDISEDYVEIANEKLGALHLEHPISLQTGSEILFTATDVSK